MLVRCRGRKLEIMRSQLGIDGALYGASLMGLHRGLKRRLEISAPGKHEPIAIETNAVPRQQALACEIIPKLVCWISKSTDTAASTSTRIPWVPKNCIGPVPVSRRMESPRSSPPSLPTRSRSMARRSSNLADASRARPAGPTAHSWLPHRRTIPQRGSGRPRSAHPAEVIHPADVDEMRRLLEAAQGLTRLVTPLAPEMDNGFKVTRMLANQGIMCPPGHVSAAIRPGSTSRRDRRRPAHVYTSGQRLSQAISPPRQHHPTRP